MSNKLIKKQADKIRFVLVGSANTTIDFSILFILVNLTKLPIFYSNVVSTSVALSFSFIANKRFTFKDKNPDTRKQLIRFLAITLTGLWLVQPIIIGLVGASFHYSKLDENIILLVGKLSASCFTLVWNYVMYKKFVFSSNKQ